MASPSALAPLLRCPAGPHALRNPTALPCGHAVCSVHLDAAPLCPVPVCPLPPAPARPRIPALSRVHYAAAPPAQPPVPPPVSDHRSDVTLNKIIALVDRTLARLHPDPSPAPDSDSDSDAADAPRPASSARPAARRDSSHPRSPLPPPVRGRPRAPRPRRPAAPPSLPPTSGPPVPPSDDAILAEFDKKLLEELTCHICYVLFYQPVTTPCQHTYCAKCLQRSLDHSTTCPVCRHELPTYFFQDQPVNKTIMAIILKAYPLLYQERGDAIEEEERHARLNTPIFVCNLTFPGIPTFLHFFEPRYRLMLRRCLESPYPRFGMIMSPKAGSPQTDYGVMLEIRSVQMLPDGRSMVETWGSTRFRILERGTLDGYMVGRVERIDDYADDLTETLVLDDEEPNAALTPIPAPDRLLRRIASTLTGVSSSVQPTASVSAIATPSISSSSSSAAASTPRAPRQPTNAELMDTCRAFLDRLQRGAAPWVVQRLSQTYGAMPSDPAQFAFWVALVLPIEEHEKAKLLPIRSARLRLMLVVHWIEQLNNNWYAWVFLAFVKGSGWVAHPKSPVLLCLLWTVVVLTLSRFIGWI
ncbi:LON-domain-containing protein [Pholiota molesta]|nr:LON-domain-containing protein [Pholiota molesta]